MSSTTCKADTVAAAAQATISHQQSALDPPAPASPLLSLEAQTDCTASAMDACQSQSVLFAEQGRETPTQPAHPTVPAISDDLQGWLREENRKILESHRADRAEWDRAVRALRCDRPREQTVRPSRLQHTEEQHRNRFAACLSSMSQRLAFDSASTSKDVPFDDGNERTKRSSRDLSTRGSTSLLSLPPHIRTRVYTYLLTDPDSPSTVVNIKRQLQLPCYKLTRPLEPTLDYSLSPQPMSPFTNSILRTSKAVYAEALPILYADKIFYPHDLEGLLVIFFNDLSPFARSCIRSIRLPASSPGSAAFNKRKARRFHWAISCAQIAKLNDTLHTLEICGQEILQPRAPQQSLMHPLCKIKAQKRLVGLVSTSRETISHAEARFADLLREAEEFLKTHAKVRQERARAEAAERARNVAQEEEEQRIREAKKAKGAEKDARADEDTELQCKQRVVPEESHILYLGRRSLDAFDLQQATKRKVEQECNNKELFESEEEEMRDNEKGCRAREPEENKYHDLIILRDYPALMTIESTRLAKARLLERISLPQWKDWPKTSHGQIEQDLGRVKGLEQFQKELGALDELEEEGYEVVNRVDLPSSSTDGSEDWDLVSVRSRKSATKEDGHGSDDEWQDTASTIVDNDHDDDDSGDFGRKTGLHKVDD